MKTILVTAIGSFAAEAVIRTYKEAGYRVLGCDIYPAQWVANSEDVVHFFKAPYATEKEEYIAFIKKVCGEEQVDALIPLTDVEVDVLTAVPKEELRATVCISDPEAIALCRDKYRLEQFLSPLGICETIRGRRLSELDSTDLEHLKYPLVVKPFNGRSSQGLHIVDNATQMAGVLEVCESELDLYLVQKKIPGSIVTVDVVRNAASGEIVCLPRKELLRTLNGAGTSVCVFRDADLEAQCGAIVKALGINGCVNLEFVEEAPGKWYFLECNPRFAGGVAFSCKAGYDMVINHLRCFEGKDIDPMGEIRTGYIARRYVEYLM